MPTNGLTVIARIIPGRERMLTEMLNRIGNDINGKRLASGGPHIDFPKTRYLHFARLVVVPDPDAGPGRMRLLFASDYDGHERDHAEEILRLTQDPDALWGCCEGYGGREQFAAFLLARHVAPQAYYIAFNNLTAEHLRQQRETPGGVLNESQLLEERILRFVRVAGSVLRAALDSLIAAIRFGPLNAVLAARTIIATMERFPLAGILNRITFNSVPKPSSPYSSAPLTACAGCVPATPEDEVQTGRSENGTMLPAEDLISQNQLTLLTVIKPERLRRLNAVLAGIDIYAQHLAPPGSLVGISTIHTVRWVIIDEGRRLLMISNYDGSWENYIDEFAEMILSGLDAIWENSYGYPTDGAQDVAALKHFLRCHQAPANVFYSAYPDMTVLNILDSGAAVCEPDKVRHLS